MKKNYFVKVSGCDDHTRIEVELSTAEATFLRRIADEVSKASHSQCEPNMVVWLVGDPEPEPYDEDEDGGAA